MSKKKVARPGVTSTETGGKSAIKVHSFSHVDLRLSHSHCTTGKAARQAGILDIIPRTKDAALTGRELAQLLHTSTRAVSQSIEALRRRGCPILSDTGGANPGYWMSDDAVEIRTFTDSMKRRAAAILEVARAVEGGGFGG